jgi:hypothetical protein
MTVNPSGPEIPAKIGGAELVKGSAPPFALGNSLM